MSGVTTLAIAWLTTAAASALFGLLVGGLALLAMASVVTPLMRLRRSPR